MQNVVAIARRELRTYFNSPIAYIVLGVFLVTAGWLFFFYSGLFIVGRATLRPFFTVAPLLFMFLAPAITMRLLAEERKTGTLESLLTLPVKEWEVVVGKLLAALGMVAVGLLFTIAFPLTLSSLTATGFSFDWGPVVGGYVGLLLMAGAFLAVGMWASAMSKNQIVGFIVGLLICFVLWILDKATIILPQSLAQIFEYLSVTYHFENFAKGVLDSRDVLYYVAVIAAGVLLSVRALSHGRRDASQRLAFVALAIGSLVLVNVLSVSLFFRIDLTRDRAFTLSQATRDTLAKLQDPVTVKAYFTKDLPPPFSSNARYVRDLLEEYRARSGGNVSFEFTDPQSQETAEDKEKKKDVKRDIFGRTLREQTSIETELEGLGIRPVEIRVVEDDQAQTKRAYMGLVLRSGDKQPEVVPVVQGVDSLEYDLTTMIRRLTREKAPVLGVLQGHGEPTLEAELQKLMPLLQQNYEVKPITLAAEGDVKVEDGVDALLVIGPKTSVTPPQMAAIDQFLMKGKSAAFFLDRAIVDYKTFAPEAAQHGLDGLIGAYGIEMGPQIVGDVESANLSVSERRGFMVIQRPVRYPFIPTVKQLEVKSPLTKGISDVTLPFTAPLFTTAKDGVEHTTLAKSSAKSWLEEPTQEALQVGREYQAGDITFTGPYDLIVQARGTLPSWVVGAGGATAPDVIAKSEKEARVVVVGGSGFLNEQVLSPQNAGLLLNIVDWMLLDPALLEMRSRGLADAPLQAELSDGIRAAAKFGNVVGVPLLLIGYGVVRWRLREQKRARLRTS